MNIRSTHQSAIVTDDGARHAEENGSGISDPIYDPSPLPAVPAGTTFSPEQKQAGLRLFVPD